MAARIIAKPMDAMKVIFRKTRRSRSCGSPLCVLAKKGVRVTSDQRIIALLDNLFVFFRLCRHFLLPPLFFIRYFLESCASRSGYWMCRGGMEFPLASDARLASYLAPSLLRLASNGRP
jgi:hypothetical protein